MQTNNFLNSEQETGLGEPATLAVAIASGGMALYKSIKAGSPANDPRNIEWTKEMAMEYLLGEILSHYPPERYKINESAQEGWALVEKFAELMIEDGKVHGGGGTLNFPSIFFQEVGGKEAFRFLFIDKLTEVETQQTLLLAQEAQQRLINNYQTHKSNHKLIDIILVTTALVCSGLGARMLLKKPDK